MNENQALLNGVSHLMYLAPITSHYKVIGFSYNKRKVASTYLSIAVEGIKECGEDHSLIPLTMLLPKDNHMKRSMAKKHLWLHIYKAHPGLRR